MNPEMISGRNKKKEFNKNPNDQSGKIPKNIPGKILDLGRNSG